MKRKLIVLMAAIMAAVMQARASVGQVFQNVGGYNYTVLTEDAANKVGTAKVSAYVGNAESVTVPSSFEKNGITYTVVEIADLSFESKTTIKSIILPNTITTVGRAFKGCSNLTTILIPENVTSIKYSAFENCSSLTSITFPSSLQSLGNTMFDGCSVLTEIYFLSTTSIPTIQTNTFYSCSGKSIYVPKGYKSSYETAWGNALTNHSLTLQEFDPNAAKVGDVVVKDNFKYTVLSIDAEDRRVSVSSADGATFSEALTLEQAAIIDNQSYSITEIADNAFQNLADITSFTVPATLEKIGANAFNGCSNLATINISGLTPPTLGTGAFSGIASNPVISLPSEIYHLYAATDWNNVGTLTPVFAANGSDITVGDFTYKISQGKTYADVSAAEGKNLTGELTLPTSVTIAGVTYNILFVSPEGFKGQTGITSLIIPVEIIRINENAFQGCSSLKEISLADYTGKDNRLEKVGNPFSGIAQDAVVNLPRHMAYTFYKDGWSAVGECRCTFSGGIFDYSVTSFEDLAVEVTKLSNGNYTGENLNLTDIVAANDAHYYVRSIAKDCFKGCTSIKTLKTIASNIGESAFEGCTGLETVKFLGEMDEIGANAFKGCSNLATIYSVKKSVAKLGTDAFTNVKADCKVKVCHSALDAYTTAWGSCFANGNILPLDYIKFTCETHEGAVSYAVTPKNQDQWGAEYIETVYEPVVGASYHIGYSYFDGPVTTIPASGFQYLVALRTIEIPETVTKIGDHAFNGCTWLKSINIPNSVTKIEDDVFYNCPEVRAITVGTGLTDISNLTHQLFLGCANIQNITFYGDNPPTTSLSYPLYLGTLNPKIYVPAGKVNAYKSATNWTSYSFEEIPTSYTLQEYPGVGAAKAYDYYQPYDVENCTASYTRVFTNTNWQGLFLPFDMNYDDWKDLGTMAQLTGVEDGVLEWSIIESGGKTEAGKPYIFQPKATGSTTFTGTNTTLRHFDYLQPVVIDGYVLSGTYINKTDMAAIKGYALSAGNFYYTTDASKVLKPFRIFLTVPSPSSAPVRSRINGEDVTGIDDIVFDGQFTDGKAYNMQGVRVGSDYKGIVIVNGKKVLRK